eukprot:CAMPEP_0198200908 /NCGR_PEP_ID=MMETSP1445-20131203/3796_1 /TAXON_ID=36898 /ORGANISM="Pyramimonas sp., Strain CCMP2087" /LENGTH=275 /DNA_ID=CAMNT_0043871075 /DNA_START=154 /DNA_END=981 /DNA_ORIENTATION=-
MTLRACSLLRLCICVLAVTLHASAMDAVASRSLLRTCEDYVERMQAELAANSTTTLAVMIGNATVECNMTIHSNDSSAPANFTLCSKSASEPSIDLYCANTCSLCTQQPTRAPTQPPTQAPTDTRAPTQAPTDTPVALTSGENTECSSGTTLVYLLASNPSTLLAELIRELSPSQCGQTCVPDLAFSVAAFAQDVGEGSCAEVGYGDISQVLPVTVTVITVKVAIFECTTACASPTAAPTAGVAESPSSAPRVFWSSVGSMWMVGHVAFVLASVL